MHKDLHIHIIYKRNQELEMTVLSSGVTEMMTKPEVDNNVVIS